MHCSLGHLVVALFVVLNGVLASTPYYYLPMSVKDAEAVNKAMRKVVLASPPAPVFPNPMAAFKGIITADQHAMESNPTMTGAKSMKISDAEKLATHPWFRMNSIPQGYTPKGLNPYMDEFVSAASASSGQDDEGPVFLMGEWSQVWKRLAKRIANHNPYAESYITNDKLLEDFYRPKWESEKAEYLKAQAAKHEAVVRACGYANATLNQAIADLESAKVANHEAQDALVRVSSVSRESELRDPSLAAKMNAFRLDASAKQLQEDRLRLAVEDARKFLANQELALQKHSQLFEDATKFPQQYNDAKKAAVKNLEESSRKAEKIFGKELEVTAVTAQQIKQDLVMASHTPGGTLTMKPDNPDNWFSPINVWATAIDKAATQAKQAQGAWEKFNQQQQQNTQNSNNNKNNNNAANSNSNASGQQGNLASFAGMGTGQQFSSLPDWNTNSMAPWLNFAMRAQYGSQPISQLQQQPQMMLPQMQQPQTMMMQQPQLTTMQQQQIMPQLFSEQPQLQAISMPMQMAPTSQPNQINQMQQQAWSLAPLMLSQLQATSQPNYNGQQQQQQQQHPPQQVDSEVMKQALAMYQEIENLRPLHSFGSSLTSLNPAISAVHFVGGSRPLASIGGGVTLRLRMIVTLIDSLVSLLASFVSPPWMMVWLAAYMMTESNRTS